MFLNHQPDTIFSGEIPRSMAWSPRSQVPVLAALLRRLHSLDAQRASEVLAELKHLAPSAWMRLAQCGWEDMVGKYDGKIIIVVGENGKFYIMWLGKICKFA